MKEPNSIHKIRNRAHILPKESFFQKKNVGRILDLNPFVNRKSITCSHLRYESCNYLQKSFKEKYFIWFLFFSWELILTFANFIDIFLHFIYLNMFFSFIWLMYSLSSRQILFLHHLALWPSFLVVYLYSNLPTSIILFL